MKELLALIPETRRKLLLYLCEHRNEDRLRTLFRISQEARLSYLTTRKTLKKFESSGLVKVYVVGRAKVVVPTEKLKKICEILQKERRNGLCA